MPIFSYVARDASGKKVTGAIDAVTLRDAQVELAEKALFPLQLTAQASAMEAFKSRSVSPMAIATLFSQMAGLMRSGVPLLRSLAVLRKQTSSSALSDVLQRLHADVEEGIALPEAMARHPNAFSDMAVNMIRAGNEGGFLEDALERVADFTEKQQDLKARTTGALVYPIVLMVVGMLVVTGLMIFVVPRFEGLFTRLRERGELPFLTEVLLRVSRGAGNPWIMALVAAGAFGGYVLVKKQLNTEAGKDFWDRMTLKAPGLGAIVQGLSVARFCRILGTLLHNGVPILKSLKISAQATGNRILGMAITNAAENISSGEKLATPLAQCGYFPRNVVEMISVAEESNSLEKVLNDIADMLEKTTWRKLDLGVKLLEPLMLLLLASMVLCVVVALLLPVMKMSSAL